MKLRTVALPFALAAVALALPVRASSHAENKPPEKPAEAPATAPTFGPAEMEAFAKAGTPGEEHKLLARMAGDWTYTSSMWMGPGQPAMESSGSMHGEMAFGGRYLRTHWTGAFMGQAFEGSSTEGYNNLAKQYESVWIDNMSTGVMYGTGTCEAGGTVCHSTGEAWDPISGKKTSSRGTTTWTGTDSFKMEMWGPGPDGKEMKMMEIVAKRGVPTPRE